METISLFSRRIKTWCRASKINSLEAFRSFDQDFDGLISKDDMAKSLQKYLLMKPEEIVDTRLDRLFRLLSFYKTEMIQPSDFERLLHDVNPYVTASSGATQDRIFVLCYDGKSGKRLWKREYWATGRGYCHPTSANAAPTPASDGEFIYAFYSSNDLVCLDLDGNLKWFRGLTFDYPKAANDVGMSSSPIVSDGVVICQVENQGDSFVTGIDTATGKSLWRIDRKKDSNWASPAIVAGKGKRPTTVLLTDRGSVMGVDIKSGKELWKIDGGASSVSSTTVVGDTAYLAMDGTVALQFNDDSGKPNEAWKNSSLNSANASPVIHNGELFTLNASGAVTCCDAQSGTIKWKARTGRDRYWATPVASGGMLFTFDMGGSGRVLDLNDKGKTIHTYKFQDQSFLGTPAISNGAMYVRSNTHLIRISEK